MAFTYKSEGVFIVGGDCLEIMPRIAENSIDSVVTDPPYGLKFMGKDWDHGLPGVKFWKEIYRVMKPGAHLLAFGGSRTYHRLACAIEDAGFEIRDCLMWIYGSGFPKSMNVSKAIDRSGGIEAEHIKWRRGLAQDIRSKREEAGLSRKQLSKMFPQYGYVTDNWERLDDGFRVPSLIDYNKLIKELGIDPKWRDHVRAEDLRIKISGNKKNRQGDGTIYGLAHGGNEYEAATDDAKKWDGWGTALKPAHEPICLARKPLIGTVAKNVLKHDTGALNIDECRVEYQSDADKASATPQGRCTSKEIAAIGAEPDAGRDLERIGFERPEQKGRWPANVIHDGSDEVVELFPISNGQQGAVIGNEPSCKTTNIYGKFKGREAMQPRGDKGSAARFFYCSKASKKERGKDNKHPTVKPIDLIKYLCRLITPKGGVVLDPFFGSGTTALAALDEGFRCIGIEQEHEYCVTASERIAKQVEMRRGCAD